MRTSPHLDRRVQILAPVQGKDESGAPYSGLQMLKSVWAMRQDVGAREVRTSGALRGETTSVFTLRWFAGLTSEHVFVCEGKTYDLFPPQEVGRRQWWEVQAKERDGQ